MIELVSTCLDCRTRHHSQTKFGTEFLREINEWQNKHIGHRIEFNTPRRRIKRGLKFKDKEPWWLGFKPNANIKIAYASSAAMTYTSLNSLASDNNQLAGASALAVDNTSNLYLDYI